MEKLWNRKSATKLLMIQWARFQNTCISLEGSTLITGVNGSGKSTILDAITYLLTGNTQFNKAAKDKDRNVLGYVRGDTKGNGNYRYLRSGDVVSYIAMEFYDPTISEPFVVAVCIESPNEVSGPNSFWFVCPNVSIDKINFSQVEGNILRVTPKNELEANGVRIKPASFLGRDRGTEQILRALGLRCGTSKYKTKLMKMMAFNPENNIDQFIQSCVLEPGKVNSLNELREQKQQFERIKELYEELRMGKEQLEDVEEKSTEYENKRHTLLIRELMLSYQELRSREEAEKETQNEIKKFQEQLNILSEQKKELKVRQDEAQKRLRIAENNNTFQVMKDSLHNLDKQLESENKYKKTLEEQLAKIIKLQKQIIDFLSLAKEDISISEKEKKYLEHLSDKEYNLQKKITVFRNFAECVEKQNEVYNAEKVHLKDAITKRKNDIDILINKIKRLESNIMVFPREIEEARKQIQQGLLQQGIKTDVHIFAELVQEVTVPVWRSSIETFLGKKRFHIIVDGDYCHKAVEILRNKNIYSTKVVITDKLSDKEKVKGSASEILKIPNVYARRYANFLLNGIHLCESLEEFYQYPKGGLMKDGMLSKGYTAGKMDISRTDMCLGEDAIRIQLEKTNQEKINLEQLQKKDKSQLDTILSKQKNLSNIDLNSGHYNFEAAAKLEDCQKRIVEFEKDIKVIKTNPNYFAIISEQEAAKKQVYKAENELSQIEQRIGSCNTNVSNNQINLKKLSSEIQVQKQEYNEKCCQYPELKSHMLEEYERLHKKTGLWKVIKARTVDNLRGDLRNCERNLENSQREYCRIAQKDINKCGVAYISWYRTEYRELAHIKIEEARQRLDEQSKKLESAFMNDFVAEINESAREARAEIDIINDELKQLPFGSDIYQFQMDRKKDRKIFFRICDNLDKYMDSPKVYMNSSRDDEEMEHNIQEFMNIILEEDDELEYTDYRRYFSYNMKIISRQGNKDITYDLSEKQGSASNGEKQTPYFIILAASLMQCYPKNSCCARLAFIDEAFSALSRERIEQMVKYLEENQFQVFYAAPPEKIDSIGSFIGSTISLIPTGRFTRAVEGLVYD